MLLLVEDRSNLLNMFASALREAGYRVQTASTGEEAILLLLKYPFGFCAIVSDMDLGFSVSGREIVSYARKLNPGVGVIYLSASLIEADQEFGHPKPNCL